VNNDYVRDAVAKADREGDTASKAICCRGCWLLEQVKDTGIPVDRVTSVEYTHRVNITSITRQTTKQLHRQCTVIGVSNGNG